MDGRYFARSQEGGAIYEPKDGVKTNYFNICVHLRVFAEKMFLSII